MTTGWGIRTAQPVRVGIIENEGPRPFFRRKLAAKYAGWDGSPIDGRVSVRGEGWGEFTFADDYQREQLAGMIRDAGLDVVIVGPVALSGMEDAGTLQEVAAFMRLVHDVQSQADRFVAFVLVHHPNRADKVSGVFEGFVDTLVRVTSQGHGHTKLFFQKTRWSSSLHATTITLDWADGEGFTVADKPVVDDDALADLIVQVVGDDPGVGWSKVETVTGRESATTAESPGPAVRTGRVGERGQDRRRVDVDDDVFAGSGRRCSAVADPSQFCARTTTGRERPPTRHGTPGAAPAHRP